MRSEGDKLWDAITKVIDDKTATDREKLERIKTYIEVYEDINTQSFSDMA